MTITALRDYAKQATLDRAGTHVILKPLETADEHQLLQFFNRVPAEDRYYLKEDVTSPSVVASWPKNIDYARVLPLVAITEGEIVADATLHRSQAGAHHHMAEIRIAVEPRYRNHGLSTMPLQELIYIACDSGRDRVLMQLAEESERVRKRFPVGSE